VVQNPGGAPFQGNDKQLLDEIQKGGFEFFWDETNPQTGQVKDRAFSERHGQRGEKCELSFMDTSLLLCGILTVRAYFQDVEIQDLATKIYNRVEWPWMLNGGPTFSMGWMPGSGFLEARWEHYRELMMIYLLGIGSPTNPGPAETWKAFITLVRVSLAP
jgi:hypothetical protein